MMKTVICSADKIKNLADLKSAGMISSTTHIIYFDEAKPSDLEATKAAGITAISFAEVIEQGKTLGDDGSTWD